MIESCKILPLNYAESRVQQPEQIVNNITPLWYYNAFTGLSNLI